MVKALTTDTRIEICGTAANGEMAIRMAGESLPDVIVLDIEMPVMDGMTALPHLLKISPKSKVIIASTLSLRNAEISLKALALGAADTLAKPSAKSGNEAEVFYRELRDKITALAGIHALTPVSAPSAPQVVVPPPKPVAPIQLAPHANIPLRQIGVKALAIASSTGGPQALLTLFEALAGRIQGVPIFITQHMPPTFTTILADHIGKAGRRVCAEAKDGETAVAGHAYLAPGDFHMLAEATGDGRVLLRINQDAQENFCRPAADPMLRSLSRIYGKHLLVVVLTGMGQDGMEGAKVVVAAGGSVIAQDEASSVVYGMPKAVAEQGLCRAILPLTDIGKYIIQQIEGA